MKIEISFLTVLLLVGSLAATGTPITSGEVLAQQANGDSQPSDGPTRETSPLHRLALALSSGSGAMRLLRASQSDNKDWPYPAILGMECNIDRIISYVSCYSSRIRTKEEAENLLSRLVDELQAALPSDRWRGMQKEAGTASIRSYTYEDQRSNARIYIDIIDPPELSGLNSYTVSIFGWPHY